MGRIELSMPMYEVKSAGWLFLQGINKGQDFQLAVKLKSAPLFDDIVFTHKVRNESKAYFIWVKHKENPNYKIKRQSLIRLSR
jgi:hypothetical protein